MATTAKGTPYVVSTDLVANYPTVSSDLATHIDTKLAYNAMTINAQTGTTYTFVLDDAALGKLVTANNAAATTYTVPPQASVTWADGAVLQVLNIGAGVVTFAAGAGVTVNNTTSTLSQYESANLVRTASNTWQVVKGGGGLPKAAVSSTTGSPTITTVSGKTVYKWTGAGTVTISGTGGVCNILLVAGGGSGARHLCSGGGGGGGVVALTSAFLASGSHTISVGAGGASQTASNAFGNVGADSRLGPYYAYGGGGGNMDVNSAIARCKGGSGGGGGANNVNAGSAGAPGLAGQGNDGATATATNGGGGGGAGAAGSGMNGGNGVTNNFETGSNQTYGGGGGAVSGGGSVGTGGTGGGSAGSTGTSANGTDGLGGGSGCGRTASGKGGDGVVVLVIG